MSLPRRAAGWRLAPRPSIPPRMARPAAPPRRPTPAEIRAAVDKTVPDVIAPGLAVLFCGINPGLYTAAVGHHFARPGNRFWPALHAAGFTDRLLAPHEERRLLDLGYGITNLVARATATGGRALDRGAGPRRGAAREDGGEVAAAVRGGGGDRRVPGGVRQAAREARAAGRADRGGEGVGAAQPERAERALPGRGAGAVVPGAARGGGEARVSASSTPATGARRSPPLRV